MNHMANEVTESHDENFVNRFFDVTGLMDKELELYEKFIDHNRDLRNYV